MSVGLKKNLKSDFEKIIYVLLLLFCKPYATEGYYDAHMPGPLDEPKTLFVNQRNARLAHVSSQSSIDAHVLFYLTLLKYIHYVSSHYLLLLPNKNGTNFYYLTKPCIQK